MEKYNVEGRLITKDDWEKWLKSKEDICEVMNCGRRHRHDGKCTYFKEIEE